MTDQDIINKIAACQSRIESCHLRIKKMEQDPFTNVLHIKWTKAHIKEIEDIMNNLKQENK
jgi:hypothetical protein